MLLQKVMRSLIIAMVTLTAPALSQREFANFNIRKCTPQVHPDDIPAITDGLVDSSSTTNYGFLIGQLQRPASPPTQFRVLENNVVCQTISNQLGFFTSQSLVLRIECQYCIDDEVTSGVRDADGFYEYVIQVSVYCFLNGNLNLRSSNLYGYTVVNQIGAAMNILLEASVETRPLATTSTPLASRGCAICAHPSNADDIFLPFDSETWCFSKLYNQ